MLTGIALAGGAVTGCDRRVEAPVAAPRPVQVMTIAPTTDDALVLAGVVKPWADENVAAEVSGRLEFVARQGRMLTGRWLEEGQVLVDGDVLARVDPTQYDAALRAAEAEVTRARVQLEEVLPARVKEAQASVTLEEERVSRVEGAMAQNAANELELIQAQAGLDIARAQLSSVQAELESARAGLAVAEANRESAQVDRDHAVIHAPFDGEVAEVFREAGGFVSPGAAIARLVMMDPVLVEATVSGATARSIQTDDFVEVRSEAWPEPLLSKVYFKSTTADPRTLTFTVAIVTRNPMIGFDGSDGIKVVSDLFAVQPSTIGRASDMFVPETRSLIRDESGDYVWLLEPVVTDGSIEDPAAAEESGLFMARRVDVVPGDERRAFQGVVVLRTLRDTGTLEPFDFVAVDPPPDLRDGDLVRVRTTRWALRPGSVVQVQLSQRSNGDSHVEPTTIRVPTSAIRYDSVEQGTVFLVRDDRVVQVPVRLGPIVGASQVITTDPPDALVGEQVVVRGAAYLSDGERVRVIRAGIDAPYRRPMDVRERGDEHGGTSDPGGEAPNP